MFSFITRFFAPRPGGIAALSEQSRQQALQEARFLVSKGASVRELQPGEEPGEPEVGKEPL